MAYARRDSAKTSGAVDVSTGSAILIDDNPGRLELSLVNDSDTDVSVGLRVAAGLTRRDPVAVPGEGIILKANGGTWTTTSYTGPLAFVHAGIGTKSVAVAEI